MKIEVIDKIMGTGKTYSTLRYIEQLTLDDPNERWIYCAEYLEEIEINTKINDKVTWKTPDNDHETKTIHLKELLEDNNQLISITHQLLSLLYKDKDINYLIKLKGYKLYLDETIELIEPYTNVKFGDFLKAMGRSDLTVDNDNFGKVTWLLDESKLTGGHCASTDILKKDSMYGNIYCAIRSGSAGNSDSVSIVYIHHESILTQFSRVILSTYQLKNTIFAAYLHIKNIDIVEFTDIQFKYIDKESVREKITFISNHDTAFKGPAMLSSNWYSSNTKTPATADDFKKINKIIKSIGDKNGCKGNAHLLGFTVPSNKLGKQRDPKKIQPVGYPHTVCLVTIDNEGGTSESTHSKSKSTYIPCNARASNEYSGKNVMIHAFNRYPMVQVSNYLIHHNIPFSSEQFALNEMVQWVWRSAIRKGENVKIAILSSRMRDIFKTWLSK